MFVLFLLQSYWEFNFQFLNVFLIFFNILFSFCSHFTCICLSLCTTRVHVGACRGKKVVSGCMELESETVPSELHVGAGNWAWRERALSRLCSA